MTSFPLHIRLWIPLQRLLVHFLLLLVLASYAARGVMGAIRLNHNSTYQTPPMFDDQARHLECRPPRARVLAAFDLIPMVVVGPSRICLARIQQPHRLQATLPPQQAVEELGGATLPKISSKC